MVVAMTISGAGASTTHPTGYPLISANMGEARKGRALGVWGSAAKLGDAASPALVGVLILALAWNDILILLGLLGVVFSAVLFVVLNVPGLAILLFFTARMVVTQGVNTFVPAFIVDVYSYSFAYFGVDLAPESFANFYFSALLLTAAAVQLATGTLTDRYDNRKVLVGFLLVTTAALVVLSAVTLSPLPLLIVLLVVGGGLWGLNPARDALVSDITPPEREGRTFGYLWTAAQVIGAGSPVFVGFLAGVTGIQDSFMFLAGATFVSALAVGLLFSDRVYRSADAQDAAGAAD
jgi:MFS family permease